MTDVANFNPTIPAKINDHDQLAGHKSAQVWPTDANPHSLAIHYHFCELLAAWNLNPFKRVEAIGVAGVDEIAETKGVTLFNFVSSCAREDFINCYGLEEFVVRKRDAAFYWVTLTNSFGKPEVTEFLDVYKSAMQSLAVIEDERNRAIRNDGNKIGFICADHYVSRELNELMKIKYARDLLAGARV